MHVSSHKNETLRELKLHFKIYVMVHIYLRGVFVTPTIDSTVDTINNAERLLLIVKSRPLSIVFQFRLKTLMPFKFYWSRNIWFILKLT